MLTKFEIRDKVLLVAMRNPIEPGKVANLCEQHAKERQEPQPGLLVSLSSPAAVDRDGGSRNGFR